MSTPNKTNKKKQLRLYDLPRDKGIRINFDGLLIEFHHLDGMYSYCTVVEGEHKGKPFHLSASAPLVKVKKGLYKVEK